MSALSLHIESTDSMMYSLLTLWNPRHGIWKCFSCSCVLPCIPLLNMCCNCCWSSGWEVTRITVIHMPTCISYVGRNVHIGETIKRADMLPEANPHLHHSPPLDHQTTQQPGQHLLSLPMEGFHLRARLVSDAVLPREGIPMLPLFCRGIIFAVVTGMLFEVVLIL